MEPPRITIEPERAPPPMAERRGEEGIAVTDGGLRLTLGH
jgi:hypothetical protein